MYLNVEGFNLEFNFSVLFCCYINYDVKLNGYWYILILYFYML